MSDNTDIVTDLLHDVGERRKDLADAKEATESARRYETTARNHLIEGENLLGKALRAVGVTKDMLDV